MMDARLETRDLSILMHQLMPPYSFLTGVIAALIQLPRAFAVQLKRAEASKTARHKTETLIKEICLWKQSVKSIRANHLSRFARLLTVSGRWEEPASHAHSIIEIFHCSIIY